MQPNTLPTAPQPPMAPTPQAKPKDKKRIIVFGIALLVALAAIGISIAVLFKTGGVETNATEEDAQVTITTAGFNPDVVTIKKGQNVVWTSQDKDPHSLSLSTQNPPKELEGFGTDEPIANGESYSYTFDVAGSFTYQDPQAPEKFQGTVVVKE